MYVLVFFLFLNMTKHFLLQKISVKKKEKKETCSTPPAVQGVMEKLSLKRLHKTLTKLVIFSVFKEFVEMMSGVQWFTYTAWISAASLSVVHVVDVM